MHSAVSEETLLSLCVEGRLPSDSARACAGATGLQRRQLYCHRSPTDKLLLAVGQWLDDAVPHMPNRYRGLQGGYLAGGA